MDITLMREGGMNKKPVLTISKFRKYIYGEYNQLYLRKAMKTNFKHIKIGERIE